jgi:hypothetical protein
MTKKIKFIFPLLASFVMFGASTSYAASEENKHNNKYDMEIVDVKTQSYKDEYGDLITRKEYYNKKGELIKSETEKAITPTTSDNSFTATASGPHWVASTTIGRQWEPGWIQMRIYGTGSSKSYTDSSKSSYRAIDKIGVFTTLYYNTAVEDTASQTKFNASTSSATAWQQSVNCCWQYKAETNHTFEEAGYQSWYPVTVDYSS